MDFNALAYPDLITIAEVEYKAHRNENEVLIPYTEEPDVGAGDIIYQRAGKRQTTLKVLDASFLPGGTLNIGTNHPNMLTLKVENMTENAHKTNQSSSVVNIGAISGNQVQVGNQNTQITNISIQELIERVAKSNDTEAKNLLVKLSENNTISGIIGASLSGLFSSLLR